METITQITMLPQYYRATISADYIDVLGHMNVRHYLSFFDEGGWRFLADLGLDQAYFESAGMGAAALRHVLDYRAEVQLNDVIAIYNRAIARDAKKLHMMHYMINETQQTIAATMEGLGIHFDLTRRKSTPFPPAVAARIDAVVAAQNGFGWEATLSGGIGIGR